MSLKKDTVETDSSAVDMNLEKSIKKSKESKEKRQDLLDKPCVQREGTKRGNTGFGPISWKTILNRKNVFQTNANDEDKCPNV